jgi:hypothetical protein
LGGLPGDARLIVRYGMPMLRRSLLLFTLLMTSLITSTTVHASELSIAATLECSGEIHSERASDQSPGDSDRGMPHHHGSCHGHGLFIPVSSPSHALVEATSAKF